MVSATRAQRIAERIQEELSEMLIYEITDPRLQWVSITDVTVDRELAFANIFVSAVEGSARREEILAGFEHAKGFLRRELAGRIDLRTFPRLRFHWDPTPEQAERIEELMNEIRQSPPADESPAQDSSSDPGPTQGTLVEGETAGDE